MNARKVCFVIQKIAGISGGAERVLVEVANAMAARGMDVDIVTYEARDGAPHYPLAGAKHTNLFPVPSKPKLNPASNTQGGNQRAERFIKTIPNVFPLPQIKWALSYGLFVRGLRRFLLRTRPDVVVGFMPTGIMVSARAAKGLGIRVIGATHNVPAQDYGDSDRWDKNPVYVRRKIEALSDVDVLLVLLAEFRDWFAPQLQPKIRVMPNAIATATQPHVDSSQRDKVIVGVGRLTTIKRYDALIDAWALIAADHPDWRLRIFGAGPERDALLGRIHDRGLEGRAELAGVTDDIFAVYARAAIMCHPAAFEGFGLSVGEALAHGVPVVASDACSGVSALVTDRRNGRLVPDGPAFSQNLASALRQLIEDPELRARLGAHGPASMTAYAPAKIYDQWQDLLATDDRTTTRTPA